MKIYSRCHRSWGSLATSKRFFCNSQIAQDYEQIIPSMDEYKKASKFFKKGDYNLAATYYKDLLNITRLPLQKHQWSGIKDGWSDSYRNSKLLLKIYDRLAYSYLYTKKEDASDLFEF